jgi:hypothetical protein
LQDQRFVSRQQPHSVNALLIVADDSLPPIGVLENVERYAVHEGYTADDAAVGDFVPVHVRKSKMTKCTAASQI